MANQNKSNQPQNTPADSARNLNFFVIFRSVATLYLLYLCGNGIYDYFTKPEERPSVLFMIFFVLILGGGGIAIGIVSIKQYGRLKAQAEKQRLEALEAAKAAEAEETDEEDAGDEEDYDESDEEASDSEEN